MTKKKILKSEFGRNVLTLMTGTTIAQALPIAISPILTRIYSPEDFGIFALFISIVSVVAIVATARYELTIILPRKESDAANLAVLALMLSGGVSLFLMVVVYFFNQRITDLLGNPTISDWLYFVPFSIFLTGIYQCLNYWNNRKKHYKKMAISKIFQSMGMSGTQLGSGVFWQFGGGLIMGQIIGQVFAIVTLGRNISREDGIVFGNLRKLKIIANMRKFSDYPKYNMLPSFLDSFALNAPIFFVTRAFDLLTVGFLALSMRVLTAPAGLISVAIGQVYFQKIATLANITPDLLRPELISTTKKLLILSIIIFSPIVFWGEEIFRFIFGEKWGMAGQYSEWLAIAIFVRFVVTPLSTIFGVTNQLKLGALWKIIYFITTVGVLFFSLNLEFDLLLKIYVGNEVFMYLLYYSFIYHASNNYKKRVKV